MTWLAVGPNNDEFTTFVLYSKELMANQNPNTNLGHPSILLSTNDIEKTYEKLVNNEVKVSELMIMPYGKMFHFFDQDNNQYVIREDK
jgi:hypothetical protein